MRRIVIAVALLVAVISGLACWPLARALLTYQRGHAGIVQIYRIPADGGVAVRAVWEVEVAPGRWLLADEQRDHLFRPLGDPVLPADEAESLSARLMPDRTGRRQGAHAFWKANDPEGTAFIIDVTQTHPWRRYILGLIACGAGLITARIAWAGRARPEHLP